MLCAAVRCIGYPPGEGSPDKTAHRTVLSPLLRFSQKGFLASAQILPQRRCLWNPPPFKKGGRKLICCLIFERGAGRAALRRRSVSGYASYRRKTCEMRRNRKTRNSLIFECACCAAFGLPEVYADTRVGRLKIAQCVQSDSQNPSDFRVWCRSCGFAAAKRIGIRELPPENVRNAPQSEIRCGSHR